MSTRFLFRQKDKSAPSTAESTPTKNSTPLSEEASAIKLPGSLSGPVKHSGFLFKKSTKRGVFGTGSWQKRFFVLTKDGLAYREKEVEDAEWKGTWKIPSEVTSVEIPSDGAKEFTLSVVEGGKSKEMKLSGTDFDVAKEWAEQISSVLRAGLATPAKNLTTELAIEDASAAAPKEEEQVSSVETQESAPAFAEEIESAQAIVEDEPVPIETEMSKSSGGWWPFSMCCAAE